MSHIEEEKESRYDQAIRTCVRKSAHEQLPLPEGFEANGGKRLYSITTIARNNVYGGTRTVVVCDSFERARRIVEHNQGDIWEYSYMLCVIEAVACNWLYNTSLMDERYWYVWALDENKYVPIEAPEVYNGIVNWGIG